MRPMTTVSNGKRLIAILALLVLVGAACGDDSGSGDEGTDPGTDDGGEVSDEGGEVSDVSDEQNACPAAGCEITIDAVENAGDELLITWTANFSPAVSKNHIHVYWDTFDPDQVSNDAADRGVEQGDWVPTDEHPQFTTEGPVSVGARADSTTLCVTAADRDHNVLDAAAENCFDVAALLS